jgi:hypothetical protein
MVSAVFGGMVVFRMAFYRDFVKMLIKSATYIAVIVETIPCDCLLVLIITFSCHPLVEKYPPDPTG